MTHAAVGTIGQQDPSNWSDPSAILSMLNSQKDAISAALPPELSRALGASGLLAGLGGAAAAATRTAASTVSSAATTASSTASSAARSAEAAASRVPAACCVELERLPDVGDHSHRHCRAARDLVVHDPESKAARAGENGPSVDPGRIRLAARRLLRPTRCTTENSVCVMGLGGALVALATRAAEGSSGAISRRRHLCHRTGGDRRRLLQPSLRHPRRRTERARREPGRSPRGDDARARP